MHLTRLALLGAQVNAFFLKYVLWIPPLNPLNTIRLLILFLTALPTAKASAARDTLGAGRLRRAESELFPSSCWVAAGQCAV